MRSVRRFLGLGLLVLLAPGTGLGQSTDEAAALRRELEALKEGQAAIQRQLQEIQNLLRAGPSGGQPGAGATQAVVDTDGAPFKGDRHARVTVVEFSDYQCPFCVQHARGTLTEIDRDYVQTGKVRYVFRDFPIEAIHPQAFKAAEAAHCAGEQGRYWPMHDRLFGNQSALSALSPHAQAVGLDVAAFDQCLQSGKYATKVRQGLLDGAKVGVTGTPTFFVGLTDPASSKVTVRRVIRGALPYANFKQAIDGLLAAPN